MIDVAVLAGGRSAEHDISLSSGAQVLRNLDRTRFRPWPVLLDRQGLWHVASNALQPGENVLEGFRVPGMSARRPGAALDWLIEHASLRVVFPVLHGAFGEDGTVQALCELHDVPVVGSGTAASAVAMDKIRTRECLVANGVPMAAAYVSPTRADQADPNVEAAHIEASVGFPCFLKMDLSGSTTGVLKAERPGDVASFLAVGKGIGYRFMAEALLRGEEISVGVLGNSDADLRALPPIGIYPKADAYFTRHAKYTPGASEEVVPPRGLDAAQVAAVQALAVRCHHALQCDGMSRTDMIVTAQGPFVLEVNTIPGMTKTSLLPQCARAVGIEFDSLVAMLIDYALVKRPHPLARVRARQETVA